MSVLFAGLVQTELNDLQFVVDCSFRPGHLDQFAEGRKRDCFLVAVKPVALTFVASAVFAVSAL